MTDLLLLVSLCALLILPGCREGAAGDGAKPPAEDRWTALRERMVREQIEPRAIRDAKTLAALRKVPRHLFVPGEVSHLAYEDYPLPIGEGQTISQPYIVAYMTEALRLRGGEKVLEIGTGSGYQAAILAEIAAEVYSIEIVTSLAASAAERLAALGFTNVRVRAGDGYRGWPEAAPFDGILVTAAPDHVPQPLVDELKPGGRLVIPVGADSQELRVLVKRADGGLDEERSLPVRFVPMTGEAEAR
jgi:protein-L-isoaspartate(D-aspartate) O-methyltransferase